MKTVMLGFTLSGGAVNDYFSAVTQKFMEHGYQVVIVSDGQSTDRVVRQGNPIILTWPSSRPTKIADIQFFIREVIRYRPNIIVSNFSSVTIMTILGFLCRVPIRIAWVHTVSSAIGNTSILSKLRKRIVYLFATKLIANSKATKKDLVTNTRVAEKKIDIFTNAIKVEEIEPYKRDEKLFVYVGGLYYNKGVDILIDAFQYLDKEYSDVKLKIVGGGEELENLKRQVEILHLEQRIEFLGWVSKRNINKEFATSLCCVIPSRHEAFGYVVVEAMSVDTVVIGANIEGLSEIIDDEKSGLLFEPENSKDLSEKMKMILDNKDLCSEYRKNAHSKLEKTFNLNNVSESFVKMCDENMKKRGVYDGN